MRYTVRQWAAKQRVSERTIRDKLNRGTLTGIKEKDPYTGVEMWFVIDDEPELPGPEDQSRGMEPAATGNGAPGAEWDPPGEAFADAFDRFYEVLDKLHRENLELAGRLGFYQAKVQELEGMKSRLLARIASLEAPKEAAPEMASHPAYVENGANSSSEKVSKRPWWRFWQP